MKAIVGLGNPGREYASTRHNAGFWLVERLAEQVGLSASNWKSKGNCLYARTSLGAHETILALPQSFMNRSGEAFQPISHYFKIATEDLVVVHDEMDLDPGSLRLKRGGSAGGHHGVEDLVRHLGSDSFYRVRIGIGHPRRAGEGQTQGRVDVSSWVLSPPRGEDRKKILDAVERARAAIEVLFDSGLEAAQREYNS